LETSWNVSTRHDDGTTSKSGLGTDDSSGVTMLRAVVVWLLLLLLLLLLLTRDRSDTSSRSKSIASSQAFSFRRGKAAEPL
jgi:hypothetical protein